MYWLLSTSARFSVGISVKVSGICSAGSPAPVICPMSMSRCSWGICLNVKQKEYLSLLQKIGELHIAPMIVLLLLLSSGSTSATDGSSTSKGRNQLKNSLKNGKRLSCEKVLM